MTRFRYKILYCILWLILCLQIIRFFFLNNNPASYDTLCYLRASYIFKLKGGIGNFIPLFFQGQYHHAIEHPLYIMLISPFAERSIQFYIKAKVVSLVILVVFFLVVYLISKRKFHPLFGSLYFFLFVTNYHTYKWSILVSCESLLLLLSFLLFYFTFRNSIYKFFILGALTGLAYLTKSSALLICISYLIMLLLLKNRVRNLIYFTFAFFVFSSPLIWRNCLVYHDPFYNINKHIIWLDSWEQFYSPYFYLAPPTMISYFKTHSLREIKERFLNGLKRECGQFLLLFQTVNFKKIFFSILLWIFFFKSIILKSNVKELKYVTLILFAIFFLFLSWFSQISASPRHVIPLLPFLFFYIAEGISSSLKENHLFILLLIASLIFLVFTAFHFPYNRKPVELPPDTYTLMEWLQKNLSYQDRFILPPTHRFPTFYFSEIQAQEFFFPLVRSWQELSLFICKNKINYIIITPENFVRRWYLLKDFIDLNEGSLKIKKIPLSWEVVYMDSNYPTDFIIFKVK